MFYVYEWFIVDTGEIFYVGKGCNHRYRVRKHNKFFNDMIKRYKCDSRIVRTFNCEKDAFDYEYQRITELKEKGQCVCNIYDGGCGGTVSWWTDDTRKSYSENNIMKSEHHRERMKTNNPMSNPEIAEKTNSQKRRIVIIGETTYKSIKETKDILGISYSNILTWSKRGFTPNGEKCYIEPQKQQWHNKVQGNQQPSHTKSDNSSVEGSTTNG